MNRLLTSTTAMVLALAGPAFADMEAATAFLDSEIGDVSTLTREEQEAEMQWFVDAAEPFQGMSINVVSETITTHEYESQVLAPAFTAITGIQVTHDLIGEGDVVEKLQTQMQSGENIYDAYVNDSDLIGTHWRYNQVRNLTDWMDGGGRGRNLADAGPGRLHRAPVRHRARRQALPAAGPAIRQPLLVPRRLVRRRPEQGRLPGAVRLRAGRPDQLGGLRGHRRVLHRPRPLPPGRRGRGLRQHGLRQEGPLARLALHRRVDVDGRHGRRGRTERPAGGRMGHPGGRELPPRRVLRGARRRDERRSRGLRRDQGDRVAQQVHAADRHGHDLRGGRPDPRAGQHRPTDVLVHRLHRGHREAGPAGDERGRHAQVAHGPLAARRLLEGGPEGRLPGCRFLDADAVHPPSTARRPPGSTRSSSPPRRWT